MSRLPAIDPASADAKAVASVVVNVFTNHLNHAAATDNDLPGVRTGMAGAA